MRVMMAQFNMTRAPINDVHVRRAISYAFDYDGFNKDILGGLVERNPDAAAQHHLGRAQGREGLQLRHRQGQGRARTGQRQARPADRARLPHRFQQSEQAAQLLPERPHQGRRAVQGDGLCRGRRSSSDSRIPNTTPDISIYWISTYYADPHNWVGEMFSLLTAGTFKNAAHYKNPKVDELLDKALSLTDQAERAKLYEEATASSSTRRRACGSTTPSGTGPTRTSSRASSSVRSASAQEMRTAYYEG